MVGKDIPDKLSELAGGERKRGEYHTQLIRAIYARQQEVSAGSDFEQLRLGFAGMVGKQKELEGRVLRVEGQLSALMAKGS
jgi:hypothetical protein